jgi:hypothetical protein
MMRAMLLNVHNGVKTRVCGTETEVTRKLNPEIGFFCEVVVDALLATDKVDTIVLCTDEEQASTKYQPLVELLRTDGIEMQVIAS